MNQKNVFIYFLWPAFKGLHGWTLGQVKITTAVKNNKYLFNVYISFKYYEKLYIIIHYRSSYARTTLFLTEIISQSDSSDQNTNNNSAFS